MNSKIIAVDFDGLYVRTSGRRLESHIQMLLNM